MTDTASQNMSLLEITRVFASIGILSFGGPAAQMALMHRVLVEERGWLSERGYLNALSFCMLLPGPEAMQLATYAGWRLNGIWGGLIAGGLFVLPGAMVIFALGWLYVSFGDVALVDTLFMGVQAAAVVLVIDALRKLSRRALKGRIAWLLALGAFVAIFFFQMPFPLIILVAGVIGALVFTRQADAQFDRAAPASMSQTVRVFAIGAVLWITPILLFSLFGGAPILTEIALFFSKLAVVTFGGAYAVLAYMAQDVVDAFGWLSANEMMDGLGLAETTPGPLILVTQFVGFLAAFKEGGFALAFTAGLLTLWVTFVPCFIWIFAGAPYIERIAAAPRLNGALTAITAAVVGVILNLSLWFALHVVFGEVSARNFGPLRLWMPFVGSIDWSSIFLIMFAAYLMLVKRLSVVLVLCCSALFAVLVTMVGSNIAMALMT